MTEQNTQLSGPDLGAGVPIAGIGVGAMLLGHANGEPVLLARVGEEFFAIGATCSHYGGPLAEGLLDGDTVRCPWHHACFSLRNGDALRAPALSPVPCWRVQRDADRVRVIKKLERDVLASVAPGPRDASVREVVIIGAGAAGTAAAEMLRRSGFDGRVALVDAEADSPYDRPNLSKDYLAGSAPAEWIPLRPTGFHAEHGIELVRARVTRIDPGARRVELAAGTPLSYDALLLATGAEPVRLPLEGAESPRVHYLRSLGDSNSIIASAASATQAVVVGGSFIGLEVAAALRTRGLAVHLVAPERLPLERVLGPQLGGFIRRLHEEHGVVFHLERKPQRVTATAVVLDDGTELPADLVVIGVGVKPRLELAESAGLALDRGISVNPLLETSAPDIWAAGDIARWPDPHSGEKIRVEHWVVAQRMGQAAARNILGAREPFTQVPFFWSAHYDVSINYVGHAEHWDQLSVDGSAEQRDVAVRFLQRGRTLALATIFRDAESLAFERELEQAIPAPA
jgi:NADPH-dependent 2,4-dienoyl-CoA reductase/sulfur reductase-like enzyme/nitrite reductase/ring-hydroxylating ferredoxin subunit